MSRKHYLLAVSCVLLALAAGVFQWVNAQYAAPAPTPSVPGGYYSDAFVLELNAPAGGRIYYTTDGSTPTTDSLVYTGGIEIADRSAEPNVYKSIRNVVPDWQNYTPSTASVSKGTVVRAIYVSPFGERSDVLTQTYFVGLEEPEQGLTLSLVFEDADMFGTDGIYVTGEEYDRWYLSGGEGEAPVPNFQKDTEIPVVTELVGSQGDILNQAAGLRLQGNSSRTIPDKRMTLTARQKYSGSTVFDAPIFGEIATHSFMLKNVAVDAMAAELVSDRSVSAQRSVPVRVFLNGEYWEDTYMLERYDSQYFRSHYDVSERLRVKDAGMDKESRELAGSDVYGEYIYWIQHTDFADEAQWASFQAETDVQSYIDYISINYFLCNYDFSHWHNHLAWRSAYKSSNPMEDQRWRWCLYDLDAFVGTQYKYPEMPAAEINIFAPPKTSEEYQINQSPLFQVFKQNEQARQQFVISFLDIGNNNFAPERLEPVLVKYGMDQDWVKEYFEDRLPCAAKYLAQEFNLTGTLETVTVTTENPQMGSVQVNTSVIDLDDGTWSGQYFTDFPITLTAIANDGYEFSGWKGAQNETSATITVSMENGPVLEAVFVESK